LLSPETALALRSVVAALSIAANVGLIVGIAHEDGHPPGEDHEWRRIASRFVVNLSLLPMRLRSYPRGELPTNTAVSLLEGTAATVAFGTVGVMFGELGTRPRDLWFGGFVGASVFGLFNAMLVWDDRASEAATLWTSVGVGLATTVGGVTLALTEPGGDEAAALWVFTGLSAATTIHQTVWAIVGPGARTAPPQPRVAWGVTGVGRGLGASLWGMW